ncbi:MAG: DUF624 domain-containing protein [Oscillospiraceae bacterium]|nr:DUF624 domain-containing protein [Oscillospiraceae bacterium]
MAGFFGLFDFTKPGKGVDVNAPPKKAFFRFWELYWRKFSRFILLNLLAFLFLLPIVTLAFQAFNAWLYGMMSESAITEMLLGAEEGENTIVFGILQSILMSASFSLPAPVALFLLAISVVFYGPAMCGMTYILRNFSREEHAWLSDFFVQMKKNFAQGVALGLLELLAISLLFFNITTQAVEDAGWLSASLPLIQYISIFLLVIILFTRQYTYAMAVTFDLKFPVIIKNSFAFAFIGLFRNIGVLLFQAALIFAVLFVPYADIILMPFFFFSLTGFLAIFATFPLINKHMLLPAMERKRAAEEAGEQDKETDNGEGPA